ncbi:MAG: DUF354 domain-containing protein [bacterium]|nr:DUF354 domain-containing protein [bacterium]
MKILIDINHPAHVHLFRYFTQQFKARGHQVIFTTREKEISTYLLKAFGFDYISFGKHYKSIAGKLWGQIKFNYLLYKVARAFKPDLFLSMGSMYAAQVSSLMRKPHIALDDTEHKASHHILYVPFSDVLVNPSCFTKEFGKKQIKYDGFQELAYLHPNYFKPDPEILKLLGVGVNERYTLLRFVSWDASHDIGQSGISMEMKRKIVKELSARTRVFISSETTLPEDLRQYELKIPPEKVHHLLYYAALYLGESPTMTTESALLGTPALCVSSWAHFCGNFMELRKYDLIESYTPPDEEKTLQKAIQILENKNSKKEWKTKQQKLLKDKIDVTTFLAWLVENYPESIAIIKKNNTWQQKIPPLT